MKLAAALNVYESFSNTLEIATFFDNAHFDEIWVVDFPAPRFAPTVALKLASTINCRIGLGLISSMIYDCDYVIRWLDTLVEEFGPRFDLLIGPGDKMALVRIGQRTWVPKRVMEHTIKVASDIKQMVKERDLGCAVMLGAQGPRMIKESSTLDGVLLNLSEPEMIKWAQDIIEPHHEDFTFGVFVPTEIVDSPNQETSSEFNYTTAVVAIGAPKALLQEFGLEDSVLRARELHAMNGKVNEEVVAAIGEKSLTRWGLFTSFEGIKDYMSLLEVHGVNHIVFGPPLSHNKKSMQLLVKGLQAI